MSGTSTCDSEREHGHPAREFPFAPALALLTVVRLCSGNSEAAAEQVQQLNQTNFPFDKFIIDCIDKLVGTQRPDYARNLLELSVQIKCLPQEAIVELGKTVAPPVNPESGGVPTYSALDDETALRAGIMRCAISDAYRYELRGETGRAVEELLQKGIRVAPDDPAPYQALIDILMSEKRFQDALQVLPEMPSAASAAFKLEIAALCHCALGNNAAAETAARQTLADGEMHPLALIVLGTLAARRGDMAAAEAFFRRSIGEAPSCAKSWLSLGMLLWSQEKKIEAWQAVRQSVELNPLNAEAVDTFRDMAERLS